MTKPEERSVFLLAHHAWGDGDMDPFMSYLADDIATP
jgi:hypothetical protein